MVDILQRLFNKILNIEKVPSDWTLLNIIILFKKGDRHKTKNYRPITLSPSIAKHFLKLI